MRTALKALPCVEPDSVRVDFKTKRAHFTAKKDSLCEADTIKEAIANAGNFKVTAFQAPVTN